MDKKSQKFNIIFSSFMINKSATKKVAYLALFAAFSAVSNLFEIKMGEIQFSLTILVSAIIGIISGGVSGFVVCLIGDLIGFFVNSWGYTYSPFVGLSTGLFALLAGIMSIKKAKTNLVMYLKLAIYFVVTLLCCTILINTLWTYFAFSTRSVSFFAYVVTRLFVRLQILNNLANYALILIIYPLLKKIKPLEELFN